MKSTFIGVLRKRSGCAPHQKAFQPLAVYQQISVVPGNQVFLCKLEQVFCYSRPRRSTRSARSPCRTDRVNRIPPRGLGTPKFSLKSSRVSARRFLECTAYEVSATQLHPIPRAQKIAAQHFKGRRSDPKANHDEAIQFYGSDLAHRNRFAAKVIGNAGRGLGKAGISAGAPMITVVRRPLRLSHVMRATRKAKCKRIR